MAAGLGNREPSTGTWSSPTIIYSGLGIYSLKTATNDNGDIVLVWSEQSEVGKETMVMKSKYYDATNKTWSDVTTIGNVPTGGLSSNSKMVQYIDVVMDSQGDVGVIWKDNSLVINTGGGASLRSNYYDAGTNTWVIDPALTLVVTGNDLLDFTIPQLAIDQNRDLVLAYTSSASILESKVFSHTTHTWKAINRVDGNQIIFPATNYPDPAFPANLYVATVQNVKLAANTNGNIYAIWKNVDVNGKERLFFNKYDNLPSSPKLSM